MGSPKCYWRRVAVCAMAGSIGLAGCASNESSAPISSVGGDNNGEMTTPPPPSQMSMPMPVQQNRAAPVSGINTPQQGNYVYNRSYNTIPKGSYAGGSTYQVKRGDTLFYIAWITGNDYRDLAKRNNIPEPYGLNVGQTLQVSNGTAPLTGSTAVVSNGTTSPQTGSGAVTGGGGMLAGNHNQPVSAGANVVPNPPSNTKMVSTGIDSQANNAYSDDSGKQNVGKMLPSNGSKMLPTSGAVVTTTVTTTAPVTAPSTTSGAVSSGSTAIAGWRWPTDGKIIDSFSAAEGGNKGIDISGSRGQPVKATADGRVVYAGNALRGYGNLIIIKHNDDYLSAYAHNDTMLVREQQEVKAGQSIATMGSTGTSSVRLHFEIRYKGKSVNPLRYLPQR
ncbi:murein hydrolase activator NlpD [Sodalis ligni]|uniref:murein hydrolase activator NlpD n=1 Tax=Sodalis ligni TaxID=2697027 RepID=UPI0019400D29|nr:murein hydrolase activator NlpD [Sodalis ligni]QWA10032.1 murein hydrolase activator NlpD [Sodalis ligni]